MLGCSFHYLAPQATPRPSRLTASPGACGNEQCAADGGGGDGRGRKERGGGAEGEEGAEGAEGVHRVPVLRDGARGGDGRGQEARQEEEEVGNAKDDLVLLFNDTLELIMLNWVLPRKFMSNGSE